VFKHLAKHVIIRYLFILAKRAGYVASELIYRPIERMTNMVYTGVEKFSELNRRNYRPAAVQKSVYQLQQWNNYYNNDNQQGEENF